MTPREILVAARERVAKGWSKRSYARDVTGQPCGYGSGAAVSFCALGAIYASADDLIAEITAVQTLRQTLGVRSIPEFNDDRKTTHADVLAAFDKAIEATAS